MFNVKFNEDFQASFDGVNIRTYKKGQVYSPSHAQESIMFRGAISGGIAQLHNEMESGKKVENKVVTPKSKKKA